MASQDIIRGVPAAGLSNKEAGGTEEKHSGNTTFKGHTLKKKRKEGEGQATMKKFLRNFIREILLAIESSWFSQFSLFV